METRDIRLTKLVIEGRFDLNLGVLNLFGDFQKRYKDKFPHVDYDTIQSRILMKEKNSMDEYDNKSLYLSPVNFGMLYDPCFEKDDFILEAKDVLQFISKQLNLEKLSRIGVRMDLMIPSKDLTEDMTKFYEKLFSKNVTRQLKAIGDFNLSFMVQDEYSLKINCSFVMVDPNRKIIGNQPKQGLLFDSDLFQENITIENANEFINSSVRYTNQQVQNFINNFLVRGLK